MTRAELKSINTWGSLELKELLKKAASIALVNTPTEQSNNRIGEATTLDVLLAILKMPQSVAYAVLKAKTDIAKLESDCVAKCQALAEEERAHEFGRVSNAYFYRLPEFPKDSDLSERFPVTHAQHILRAFFGRFPKSQASIVLSDRGFTAEDFKLQSPA